MTDNKTLADIARAAWMDCPLDGDHWAATVQAVRSKVIDECIQAQCPDCRKGDQPRYVASLDYYYHNAPAGEVGCRASRLRSIANEGKDNV